jgi:hypothetical protein
MSEIVSELLDRAYSHKPNDFLCERAAMEIERLSLTDAEREAIEWAMETFDYYAKAGHRQDKDKETADTLRSLLERMK